MSNANNRTTRKTAGKGLKSEPKTPMSFKSVISCSASHKYRHQYLKTVIMSPLSYLFFKQNSSNSSLIDHIFWWFLYLYLQLSPNGPYIYRYLYVYLNCSAQWSITRAGRIAMCPCNSFLPSPSTVFAIFFLVAKTQTIAKSYSDCCVLQFYLPMQNCNLSSCYYPLSEQLIVLG